MRRLGSGVRRAGAALRAVFANPNLRRIVSTWTLGVAADQGFLVVALVVAYDAGGVVAVSLVGLARMLPAAIVATVVDVERGGRPERVLVTANLVRAAGAGVAIVGLLVGLPALVVVAAAIISGVGALVPPTQSALLPALAASPEELVASNVASSTGEGAGTFVGPLVAGIGLVTIGPAATVALILAAFVGAALGTQVTVSEAARSQRPERHGLPLVAGLRTLARRRGAAAVMVGFGAQVTVRGALTVLVVVLAFDVLAIDDAGVGTLNAVIGLGGLVGGLASLGLAGRARLSPAFLVALVGWGAPIAFVGGLPLVTVALLAFATVGVANAALDVAGLTLLQRTLASHERAPVFAVLEVVSALGVSVGALVAPLVVTVLGVEQTLLVIGLSLPLVAVMSWPQLRRLDDEATIPERELRILRGVPMLRLLPLAALERLASDARPRSFAPGEVLIREGDPGDAYLILASGTATVEQSGRHLRTVGAGDGVGEIALLRSIRRTATVRATEPVEALVIGRSAFLAAVTGHEGAASQATGVVEERLARDRVANGG